MRYKIISTGSKGNATIINDSILIDAGVPFKALQPYYKNLQLVLLTHCHCDHFNKPTIRKLARERPSLRFGCGEWLAMPLIDCGVDKNNIDIYTVNRSFAYPGFCTIKPERLPHNVSNCCYHIWHNKFSMIYATDTNDISHVNALNYDLYMIEANHTEADIQERIQAKLDAGEYAYEYSAMQYHLSKEKADAWLHKNMGDNSEYVYMHQHECG